MEVDKGAEIEIHPQKDTLLVFPREINGDHYEMMTAQLLQNPSLRYQLRSALSSFDIEPRESLPLGYHREPFIDMNQFCRIFDLPIDPKSDQGRILGTTFLKGSMELRSDMRQAFGRRPDTKLSGIDTFRQLPVPLQFVAAFKAIQSLYLEYDLTYPDKRSTLKDYFLNHLEVTDQIAEDVLQSTAMIFADKILKIEFSDKDSGDISVTNVKREHLMGPINPNKGIHLGQDLEQVTSTLLSRIFNGVYIDYLLEDELPDYINRSEEDRKKYEDFWPKIMNFLDTAINLTGKPDNKQAMWKSYLYTKAAFAKAFEAHTKFGFDGGLDQFVNWTERVQDKEYRMRMKHVIDLLQLAHKYQLDHTGIDLAKESFSIDVIDSLEEEIISGNDHPRTTRLNVLAKLILDIESTSPDVSTRILKRSPILNNTLERMINPWGYWKYKYNK